MAIIAVLYSMGYIFYAVLWGSEPSKKFYIRLLNNRAFAIHLFVTLVVSVIAYQRCQQGYYQEAFFFAPLIFLALLRICNVLTRLYFKRDLALATRGDTSYGAYKWYWDAPAFIILSALPFICCGLAMNYFHFGVFGQVK